MAAKSKYPAWPNASDNRFIAPESMLTEVEKALAEQSVPKPNGFADILLAVMLGLAICYRDSIAEMSRLTGQDFTSVNIVGGGSQNVTLNQLTADLTGLPVYAGPTEGTALGNLAAQMIWDRAIVDLHEARRAITDSFEIRCFEPHP